MGVHREQKPSETEPYKIGVEALRKIAAGSPKSSNPLPREVTRQIAREALDAMGEDYPRYRGIDREAAQA
jgi:hypothetical protein